MLYDKIPDAPRPEFSVPPPPKSKNGSHADDGAIGTRDMKSTKATSKKARKISGPNEKEELLASEVNVVSTDKGKETKKPGGKKKGKGKKKKQEESSPEKSSANPFGDKKPNCPCFICDEDHWVRDFPYKSELKNSSRIRKTWRY